MVPSIRPRWSNAWIQIKDTKREMGRCYNGQIPRSKQWQQEQEPENKGKGAKREINSQRIIIRVINGKTIYICGHCSSGRSSKQEMEKRIDRTHRWTRKQKPQRPHSAETFRDLGNLNVHFRQKRCAYEPQLKDNERWADIVNTNNIDEEGKAEGEKGKNARQNRFFAPMGNYSK